MERINLSLTINEAKLLKKTLENLLKFLSGIGAFDDLALALSSLISKIDDAILKL